MDSHEKTTFMTMGLDIGQKTDPTAIAVVEAQLRVKPDANRPGHEKETFHFLVRFLDRLPLGTPFPDVARRAGELCRQVTGRSGKTPIVFIDVTGLGTPVLNLIREEVSGSGSLWAVFFTHGDRRTEDASERTVTLGKAFLVSRLQTLLQTGRIHLPKNAESGVLVEELLAYEIRVETDANERYGAFKVGPHDDLVTALGLAVQSVPRRPPVSLYPGGLVIGGY